MANKWTAKGLYKFYNSRYFRGHLPDIPVVWSKSIYARGRLRNIMGSTWLDGETQRPVKITLNPKYRKHPKLWEATLLHEMVHVQQWRVPAKQAHGRKFQKRMKQLAALGAWNPYW